MGERSGQVGGTDRGLNFKTESLAVWRMELSDEAKKKNGKRGQECVERIQAEQKVACGGAKMSGDVRCRKENDATKVWGGEER